MSVRGRVRAVGGDDRAVVGRRRLGFRLGVAFTERVVGRAGRLWQRQQLERERGHDRQLAGRPPRAASGGAATTAASGGATTTAGVVGVVDAGQRRQ